jgi:glycosyltransferase involved in cell wall biosynthesis
MSDDMKICVLSCFYENVSVADYTSGLLDYLQSAKNLNIRLITSHCECSKRLPKSSPTMRKGCNMISLPYLRVTSSKRPVNLLASATQMFLNALRGIYFVRNCRACDLIHFQQSSSFSFGFLPLVSLILLSSKKKIVTVHSTDWFQRVFKQSFRLYNRVDKIIVHSESMRSHLVRNGVSESRIVKAYHGVRIPPLYGLERKEVTFLGAPEERKGIICILDALRILRKMNVNVQVSIYGIYSDDERKRIELQADAKGVGENLFWGGRLTETDFNKKLQQSLFVLAPYISPVSGSNIITKAMANATPVIASDIGGLKEYLGNGGITIAPNNPEQLAHAIMSMLENPQVREQLGANGRERAQTIFSWKKIAEQTVALYVDVLEGNRSDKKRKVNSRKDYQMFEL